MKRIAFCLIALAALLAGCAKKDYLYLADMNTDTAYTVANYHQTRIQNDDKVRITVSCKNPELAAPFNVSSAAVKVTASGNVTTAGGNDNVYRVDNWGDINFPILGSLHLTGLSLTQAAELIRKRIIEGNYIKDPIVDVEFVNFRYTVLGAVGGNGTYTVDGDKITIIEAIAKAGDLASNADLGKIAVIREADGKRQVYDVDIRTKDIFDSPAYYLSQNDIIYARPKKPKSENGTKALTWVSIFLSFVTASCSVVWAIRR